MKTLRSWASLTAATAVSACVCGCQFTGFGSLPLPFTKGTGSGTYKVTAEMSNVSTLPPNAEVMVGDITVGTVTAIHYSDWRADLTISLPDRVRLPANATATIGQKSLLGAEYLELAPPTGAEKPSGLLTAGDVIPLSRTTTYPSAEDVLAALSSVLNGGGLNQLSTITSELNKALGGHEQQIRDLLENLKTLTATLNQQRTQIISTISDLDSLAAEVRNQNAMLTRAIDSIPAGLAVLNQDKANLTRALGAMSSLSAVADRVVNESSANLEANLRDLRPAVTELADAGHNLVGSLTVLPTFPFTRLTVLDGMQGDYGNLVATFDLTLPKLEKTWLTGDLAPGNANNKQSAANSNPLTAPLKNLPSPSKPSPSPSPSHSSGGGSGGLGGLLGGLTGGNG